MDKRFDVIVLGVGAMGSSACFHLARRGQRVLGLEQFAIPHNLGSSHGESRMIRLCYFEHPDYVPLLRRAYELWDELEALTGQKVLFRTGGIYMGPPEGELVSGTLRAAKQHQLPHEAIDQRELRARFPQFTMPEDFVGVFETEAGFLKPELVVATNAELALKHGAVLHGHEPAIEWTADSGGVTVRTAKATYCADRLIISGGAWSDQIITGLGVPLKVTRQILGWTQPKTPERFTMGTMPVWAFDRLDGSEQYGFPIIPGRPGFKSAHHFHGPQTSPQTINRVPQPEDEADFRPWLTTFIPEADGPLLSMAICMYTCTPDSHFIVDRHPRHPNVAIACGFSGHGFKFSSVMGEVLADLATHGSTRHPIGFLGLGRFAVTAGRRG